MHFYDLKQLLLNKGVKDLPGNSGLQKEEYNALSETFRNEIMFHLLISGKEQRTGVIHDAKKRYDE